MVSFGATRTNMQHTYRFSPPFSPHSKFHAARITLMSPEVGSAAGKKGKGWPLFIPATTLPNEGMEACPGPRLWQMSLSGIPTVCPTSKRERERVKVGWRSNLSLIEFEIIWDMYLSITQLQGLVLPKGSCLSLCPVSWLRKICRIPILIEIGKRFVSRSW